MYPNLPNKLMNELVGYYEGLSHSQVFSIDGMSKENFIEFTRAQLLSTYKCFAILDEHEPNLRRNSVYDIDDMKIIVDISTGHLKEI